MSRIVTGLSHSLVSECSLLLLVVPAHPLCHWTVAFPRALLWICYYTCFLLSHWWHKTIGWRHHNVSFHLYADNTPLYVSFESSILGDLSMARAHSTLESCAHDRYLLYINDGETEMLIIHAKDRPALLLDKLLVATELLPLSFCKEYWSCSQLDAFTWQSHYANLQIFFLFYLGTFWVSCRKFLSFQQGISLSIHICYLRAW